MSGNDNHRLFLALFLRSGSTTASGSRRHRTSRRAFGSSTPGELTTTYAPCTTLTRGARPFLSLFLRSRMLMAAPANVGLCEFLASAGR